MVIHYSILGLILFVSFFWNKFAIKKKQLDLNEKLALTPWLIVFAYIAFLAAMRTKMNDSFLYMVGFKELEGTFSAAFEALRTEDIKYALFTFVGNIFKRLISDNYHAWFALFAIIETMCFIHVYRRECNDILIPMFYFFASNIYYNYFTMMRQFIAVAICFGSVELLKQRKWIKYFICCLLAILFHPSALFAVVFMLLSMGAPWRKRQNLIVSIFAVAMMVANPIINIISNSDDESTYGYVFETLTTNTGSSPLRIAVAAIPVILSFVFRKEIEYEDSFILNMSVNMAIFEFGLITIASFTSGLYVVRLATYLSPYACILYSYLFVRIIKNRYTPILVVGFFVMFMAYYIILKQHSGDGYYISDILNIDTNGYGFDSIEYGSLLD